MTAQPDLSQVKLMAKFDFTSDDLDANRHGYMSKRQRFRLRWKSRIRVAIYTVIAMLFVGVVCYFLLIALGAGNGTTQLSALGISCLSIYLSVAAIASTINAWRVRKDLRKGLISSVQGKLAVVVNTQRGFRSFRKRAGSPYGWSRERMLQTPPINLDVPWGAAYAFEDGKNYRIYFAPYSKVVLSVECISDNGSIPDEAI